MLLTKSLRRSTYFIFKTTRKREKNKQKKQNKKRVTKYSMLRKSKRY